MKIIWIALWALSAGHIQGAVLTFEDLPDAYFFNSGDQNVGTYYTGLNFGPDVTGLSMSRFGGYPSGAFPPHSGDVVIWDAQDSTITIGFTSPIESFGIWYTSYDPLTLQAFGASNLLVGSVIGTPNTDGSIGTSSFLSFAGSDISTVDLTSTAGLFVLDDLTYRSQTTTPIPEPAFLALVGLGVVLVPKSIRSHRHPGRSPRHYRRITG